MTEAEQLKLYRGDSEAIARRLAGSAGVIGPPGPRGPAGADSTVPRTARRERREGRARPPRRARPARADGSRRPFLGDRGAARCDGTARRKRRERRAGQRLNRARPDGTGRTGWPPGIQGPEGEPSRVPGPEGPPGPEGRQGIEGSRGPAGAYMLLAGPEGRKGRRLNSGLGCPLRRCPVGPITRYGSVWFRTATQWNLTGSIFAGLWGDTPGQGPIAFRNCILQNQGETA
jgi:hypothetical protein